MRTDTARRLTRPAGLRVWHIHRLIKSKQYPNVPRLAAELEVSRRTIERDITYLRDMYGAPLEYDRQRGGYVYSEPTFELPLLDLSEGELAAMALAAMMFTEHLGSPLGPVMRRALDRLVGLLPDHVVVDPHELEQLVSFAPGHPLDDPEAAAHRFGQIMAAIKSRRRLRIRYFTASRNSESRRDLDPYNLYFARDSWYVIGYCHRRRDVRLFALQRMRSVQILPTTFKLPPDYSAAKFMRHAWQSYRGDGGPVQDVTLRFHPQVARQVSERRWHHSQQVEPQEDGSLIVRLRVALSPELTGWILRWGEFCEALGPAGLREAIRQRLAAAGRLYG